MKDNFSNQASEYSKFRPSYPPELIEHIVSFTESREMALDVATGNGQIAQKLSEYFQTVYATDISENQLQHAKQLLNVIYKKLPAEKTDFQDKQFDLITVAQAIHWFDFDQFYAEVYRLLKPDGIFAIIGYGLFRTNPESDKILSDFYYNIVGPFWDAERKYLDENYQTIPFPFKELETLHFQNKFTWTFEQLVGYLETWSAVEHYKAHNNENPIDLIRKELELTWNRSDKTVVFPMLLRLGKLKM
ncbi:class I SAM-dependent methyltransferase [Flavobacterium lindanitolerans]|uniref:Methyltransferase family protein n=1 Tax=Flavobacterium lindanitolerans TaxID=428988 RepID=A0A497TYG3_9FLAO|nr:class I SAM-dependent methyltransferase [Flavobacterium lindanitolerans]PKW29901.1 methyltransferase family protein [Flavobacterium lindanitolerans]RLJ24241.1 methyltransferase family protein [Flavobacterium lindanitolerans]